MTLIIQVPKGQEKALADEMEQRGFAVTVEDDQDFDVPQWQIDETRRRMALKNEPEPRLWSDIEAEYVAKGL